MDEEQLPTQEATKNSNHSVSEEQACEEETECVTEAENVSVPHESGESFEQLEEGP